MSNLCNSNSPSNISLQSCSTREIKITSGDVNSCQLQPIKKTEMGESNESCAVPRPSPLLQAHIGSSVPNTIAITSDTYTYVR